MSSPARPASVTPAVIERLVGLVARPRSLEGDGRDTKTSTAPAPFTLEPTVSVPISTSEDVAAAVAIARAAQVAWALRPFKERGEIALRFHDLLLERQDEVLDLIQWETGKARFHAYQEIAQVALLARHYARRGQHYLKATKHRGFMAGLTRVRELRVPKGVVGMISPWNYPLYLGVGDVIPALLAGNAVVSKADSQSPLTLLWTRALFLEAGLPEELWQVAVGSGSVVGTALIDAVDYICFTGSTSTGRTVAERAGRRLIGASLELGGKNPVIICEDADLGQAAVGTVLGAFTNAGQMCIHLERAYVHAAVYDEFVAKLVAAVESLKLGQRYDYGAECGCLVSSNQLATVASHVDDAVKKGARVLVGGQARPDIGPLMYAPTVLEGVTPEMIVHEEETFGPVLSLYRVDSEEEAIRLANKSSYGLSASVWTRDIRRGQAIAERVMCGSVNVNDGAAAAAGSIEAPMGGMRDSGLGRRHGAEGIRKYTEAQTIAIQRGMPLAPPKSVELAQYTNVITKQLKLMRFFGVR
ncbi:MAG: succinate-semialdehyde dehydrogenase (NADP(+)) [Polyangiaceae bacterium]|nr:succinate-semialdehyde dehydrogenase (NADP(+)) [Polyangiaceae bacterium]